MYWKNSEKANLPEEKELTYRVKESESYRTFFINMTDAGFVDIILMPMNGAELVEWSLFPDQPIGNLKWLNNTTYMIHRYRGVRNTPYWTFSVKFDVSEMWKTSPVFKMAWSVYHMPKPNHYPTTYRQIMDTFPSWTRLVPWIIDYEEFLF